MFSQPLCCIASWFVRASFVCIGWKSVASSWWNSRIMLFGMASSPCAEFLEAASWLSVVDSGGMLRWLLK